MNNERSLSHTKWECKYHLTWIPKYRKKELYGDLRIYLGEVLRGLAQRRGDNPQIYQKTRKRRSKNRSAKFI